MLSATWMDHLQTTSSLLKLWMAWKTVPKVGWSRLCYIFSFVCLCFFLNGFVSITVLFIVIFNIIWFEFRKLILSFLLYFLVRLLLLLLGYISYRLAVSRYNTLSTLRPGNLSFLQYLSGYYLDPKSCQVEWLQRDKVTVGSMASFLVKVSVESSISRQDYFKKCFTNFI